MKPPNLSEIWFRKLPEWVKKHNQSRLIVFVGGQGSGKSYSSMRVGYEIMGEDFDPRVNIAYFFREDFLRKLDMVDRGDVLIWDDFGIGLDSRRFMDPEQIHLTQLLETMRPLNLIVIFTTPDMSFIDARARKLFHDYVEMKRVDLQRKVAVGKWYNIFVDRWTGELKRRLLRFKIGARVITANYIYFKKPPEKITKVYEQERKKALEKLRKLQRKASRKKARSFWDMLEE